jgi:serine/threonine-protein kinase
MSGAVSESDETLQAGDCVGDYQLLMTVGAGGMGRIWVARERSSGRRFAIKTALQEQALGEKTLSVLLDEARIASRINHPNVCAIHGADRKGSTVYLVMDWSDGGSLRELLDRAEQRRLEPHMAARIVARVCAGLHAAHELSDDDGKPLNVVHRDVSPQNVLLATTGQVRLTDFGIAKARGQIHAPTQTGEVKGKLSYMAPEQVTRRDIDRRADIFALGCVLYETTTGQRPFGGDDALSTMYQLLEQPIPEPRTVLPDYPQALNNIVVKALQRDPELRYQTAEEFGRALEMFLMGDRMIVSDGDVGALVRQLLGDRVSRRELNIGKAIDEIERPPASTQPESSPTTRRTETQTLQTVVSSTPITAPPIRTRTSIWIGAVAAVVAAGVFVVMQTKSSGGGEPSVIMANAAAVHSAAAPSVVPQVNAQASPAVTLANSAATVAEAPESVTIRLKAEPAEAQWTLDDGPAMPNPQVLVVPLDARAHELRATLDGYTELRRQLTFDSDQDVSIVLKPAKHTSAAKPSTVSQPHAETNEPAATPPVAPVPSAVPKKPVRQLDPENPFAAQP